MADIRLAKPAAGASESVQCAPDARFVFDFPTTDATLARDGDNLNISFEDGSKLQLEGFYQEYNGDNLPSFNIDGTEVAAADFFQAMNEPDLMPAAGPGTGTVANGARFHEWGDSSLATGITHLNGLDWGFSRSFEWDDVPNAVGYDDDGWRGAANTVPDLDVPPAPERPYDPRNPGDDPNNPASPQNPGGYIPNTHGANIVVDEGALAKGSGQHVLHGAHDYGSFVADVHAERGGSIELAFGGKVVTLEIPQDGSLRIAPTGDASFADVNGVDIRILGAESAGDGKWVVRYEYRLDDHIDHDKRLGQDAVRYDGEGVAITVTDGSGDVTRGRITVEVHDDVPVLNSVSFAQPVVVDARDEEIRVNLDGLLTGADEEGAVLTVAVNDTVFVGHKGAGGEWIFEKGNDPEAAALRFENGEFIYTRPDADLDGDETNTYTFTATITDGDNDSVSRTNSITTIAKPKFNPDPEPTTGPKDPDPEGGEPAELAKQISSVVTDDSYVAGGTLAGVAQGQADEAAPADGAENADPAPAAAPTNSANGSFSLTMNGQPIDVTIAGEKGATITLKFSADGQLESIDGPQDEDGHIQLTSENGYGHLEVGKTEVAGDTIRVNYTFTQDTAYQRHTNSDGTEASKNELEYSADSFTVTLTDDLGQDDTGSIRVSIHDDAPVLENLAITSAGKDLLDGVDTITGTVTALEGADTDGATLKVEVNDTTFEGKRDEDGAWKFISNNAKDGETFTIEGDKFIYGRPTEDVGENDGSGSNIYTFNFTLTDADEDTVTDSKTVKTIAKPKFVEDPDPTPDPKDDPQGGEPAAPEGQISSVVTDDSWVTGGTKAPAVTPQTMADEPTPAGNAEGGESASAAEPTDSAKGSFSLTMNGQPITVTIAGEDGAAITLKFAANGKLESIDGPQDEDGHIQLNSKHGYGHLEVDETKVVDDTIKVNYTFTQTKAYEKHVDPTDTDELAYEADSFTVTLTDDLGQDDTGSIRVSIHDDAPVVTAPESIGFTYTEAVGDDIIQVVNGVFGYHEGADGLAEGGVKYSLAFDDGATSGLQARTMEGAWQSVTLTLSEDKQTVTANLAGGQKAFTLTISQDGTVSMNVEPGIAIRHPNPNDDGGANKDATLSGVKAILTVTDGDNDTVTKESPVSIEIADTAAGLSFSDQTSVFSPDLDYQPSLRINFATPDTNITLKNNSRVGNVGKDINLYGSHVAYDMDAANNVTFVQDQGTDFADGGTGDFNQTFQLIITGGKGLGVASGPAGDEFGIGNAYAQSTSNNNLYDTAHSRFHSEGVVIEPANGTVHYGIDITLSDFHSGERAIIAFYLTPQNSNDNNIVKYVELTGTTTGQEETFSIKIPEGFTKFVVAPVHTADDNANSAFCIAQIDFTQPVVTHSGSVTLVQNADGAKYDDLTWDWSEVKHTLEANGVTLQETLGKGEYAVNVEWDDHTVKATLSGNDGPFTQNGHTLFEGTLGVDGKWTINQLYKFTSAGLNLEKCPVDFSIKDGDGSETTQPLDIDLSSDALVNRFDNVEMGAFDKRPDKNPDDSGNVGWGHVAGYDNVFDVLQGKGTHDLMYGRGGHDIMFGDKTDFNDFATTLLGNKAEGDYDYKEYDPDSTEVGRFGAGENEPIVNQIYDELNTLVESGTPKSLAKLDEVVAKAEGSAEGNDALFGGVGNDILFGGAGDDYLVGTGNVAQANNVSGKPENFVAYTDSNMLFGGSGRDILVFNKADKIIDGGDDIDILLMGKKDWESYTHTDDLKNEHVTLRRLLYQTNPNEVKPYLPGMPLVRNIELLLISKNADYVEQLGITSQASLAAYGIVISGNTVTLDQTMWRDDGLHSNQGLGDYNIDRYYNASHDLYLDVLRNGNVRLEDTTGKPFDSASSNWRANDPDPNYASEASAACLMDEDNPVPLASAVPDDGEPMPDVAAFAATQPQEETPDADTAPEAAPADIVETPESFLARVEGLGGEEADIQFGTGGDDFLNSAEDSYVFADAGDDLIVYDPTDYLIDGGTGIDFLLADNAEQTHSLANMMKNWEKQGEHEENMPMVHDVEVMLKGVDTTGLQNMDALAEKYGFSIDGDRLILGEQWKEVKDSANGTTTTYENGAGVTLETTLTEVKSGGEEAGDQAAQQIVLSSNG